MGAVLLLHSKLERSHTNTRKGRSVVADGRSNVSGRGRDRTPHAYSPVHRK